MNSSMRLVNDGRWLDVVQVVEKLAAFSLEEVLLFRALIELR